MARRTNQVAWRLAVVLALGTAFGCSDPYTGRRFDRKEWLAGSRLARSRNPNPNNPRCEMVGDLKEHHLKRGMTHQQVRQLLGKPDELSTRKQFKERTGYNDQQIGLQTDRVEQYTLGQLPGRVDESVLLLRFDRLGQLVDFGALEY